MSYPEQIAKLREKLDCASYEAMREYGSDILTDRMLEEVWGDFSGTMDAHFLIVSDGLVTEFLFFLLLEYIEKKGYKP